MFLIKYNALKLILIFCVHNLVQGNVVPQQTHILFRHGERSPTTTYPNDPHKNYKWEGGLGYLTNRGKLQMYTLGKHFRTYYTGFLPKYYWPADVNFTSSYSERCLMSAQLAGAGMFPPEDFQVWNAELNWQPIPIHYLPRNLDNLIAMKSNCTEYDKEFLEVQNSSKVRQLNEENQELYNYLTKHTGITIDNIEAVESLYNTLEIEQLNNLTLPHWLNSSLMAQMRPIAAQNLAIYSETNYMKKMKGGFFLRTILNLMKKFSSGKAVPIINMYAGHDITLVHVLRALGLVDTIKPDFGASLIFELYENSVLKLFYMKNWAASPQELTLANCSSSCSLEEFEEAYETVLPVNWAEQCQIRS